ncbi:MAG: hypothetical protein K8R17_11965 [Methanosarcinales archaeon]|nr:hypothetical protein [Methanosarcinales archaeon]
MSQILWNKIPKPVNNTLRFFISSLNVPNTIHLHTQDRNGKRTGCVRALTNCPSCILSLEQGLELMRELGEPMECGIFDFYKVFSRAFGEE